MSSRDKIDPAKPLRSPTSKRRARRPKKGGSKRKKLLSPDPAKIFWVSLAACAGTPVEDFFVAAGRSVSASVLARCKSCPVRRECVEHAYIGGVDDKPLKFGFFGGFSPGERKKLSLSEALAAVDLQAPTPGDADWLKLVSDVEVSASSLAAGLVTGRSASGPEMWRTEDDRKLKEFLD